MRDAEPMCGCVHASLCAPKYFCGWEPMCVGVGGGLCTRVINGSGM